MKDPKYRKDPKGKGQWEQPGENGCKIFFSQSIEKYLLST